MVKPDPERVAPSDAAGAADVEADDTLDSLPTERTPSEPPAGSRTRPDRRSAPSTIETPHAFPPGPSDPGATARLPDRPPAGADAAHGGAPTAAGSVAVGAVNLPPGLVARAHNLKATVPSAGMMRGQGVNEPAEGTKSLARAAAAAITITEARRSAPQSTDAAGEPAAAVADLSAEPPPDGAPFPPDDSPTAVDAPALEALSEEPAERPAASEEPDLPTVAVPIERASREKPVERAGRGEPVNEATTRRLAKRAASAVAASPPPAAGPPRTGHLATELEERWTAYGVDPDTARFDRGGTIVPRASTTQRSKNSTAEGDTVLRALPTLHVAEAGHDEGEFQLGAVLGSGGMGVVNSATQTTLSREVAIKSLKPGADLEEASPQLLLEARVTGALEHPNVVPVHAIGRDQADRPLIVMKRIEGTSWDRLIAELGENGPGSVDDQLLRHLGILLQVARAVHFAHSRGILHRDLKPANVMIGEFGEVYVVDWGIALALDARAPRGLPLATEVAELAGTPAYMAPEMAACDGESFSARTDVYLLGAMLHELLTGYPPHHAPKLRDMLRHAFESAPHDYGPEVPPGVVRICHQAMAWNPADRYADAGALAVAIEEFLHHRNSTALSDEAARRLGRLLRELRTIDPLDAAALRAVRTLFGEVRFAFNQALRTWPGNAAAHEGLQTALEQMIDFELRIGEESAASLLLDELPQPRPSLRARVEQAMRDAREGEARLAHLEREADLSVGDRLRAALVAGGSLLWGLCCIATGLVRRGGLYPVSLAQFAAACAAFGALLSITAYLGRRHLYANTVTRRIAQTTVLVFASYTVLWLLADRLGLPAEATSLIAQLLGVALWLSLALHVQRSWAGMAIGTALAFGAIVLWPRYNFEWMGLGSWLGGGLSALARRLGYTSEPRSTNSPT